MCPSASPLWTVTRDNIATLDDLGAWWTLFSQGADPVVDEEDADFVAQAMTLLPEGPFDGDTWGAWTAAVKEATGRKGRGLFMPLRKALTGQSHGPDMSAVMPLLQVIKAGA
jgi:glutamyl-tRNA synthetase